MEEVSETFAYFFQEGAASEIYVLDEVIFEKLVQTAKKTTTKPGALGGNAAMMAQRAHFEGCEILLGAEMNHHFYHHNFNGSIKLVHPPQEIQDIHLVLDYSEDDVWGDLRAPRTNRFYMNHDIINTNLTILEDFHARLQEFRPDMLVISGFQLLNNRDELTNERFSLSFPLTDFELFRLPWPPARRLNAMSSLLEKQRKLSKIHLEFAAMTDGALYSQLVDLVFKNVRKILF